MRKIIFFELNEVPLRIFDEFCFKHRHSTLSRQRSSLWQYQTISEDIGHLSPWITWPSVHRGVPNSVHLLQNFGQNTTDIDVSYPPIWKILTHNGVNTGVCSSLHSYPLPNDLTHYDFYIPDPFAFSSECFPNYLQDFLTLNLQLSRQSGRNVSNSIPWSSALSLLTSASKLGFRASTFAQIGKQLFSERLHKWQSIRRRTYQSVLMFDIFMKQLEKTKPSFTTFFTNHVASSMHRYWAAAFPKDYEQNYFDDTWIDTYKNEIEFSMFKADEFITRLINFANLNPEYVVWIVTSMGQAATNAKPLETQLYLTNPELFMLSMGFNNNEWQLRPAMLPLFNIVIDSKRHAQFEQALDNLYINNQKIIYETAEAGFFSIHFGQANLHKQSNLIVFNGSPMAFEQLGLENIEIEDKSGASAYHIPQGCLLIYDPMDLSKKVISNPQISTLDIAPTILENFSIDPPKYMHSPARLGCHK